MPAYKAWDGHNMFCCGGRLMWGPDLGTLICNLLMVLTPLSVYWSLVCPHLWTQLSPIIVVASVPGGLLILFALLRTGTMDPGVIPRAKPPPGWDPSPDDPPITDPDQLTDLTNRRRGFKSVIKNGTTLRIKYCTTCHVWRPPRTSHCRQCDNCVEKFDHHCPWTGTCIGKRNYRFFVLFVLSVPLEAAYITATCVAQLVVMTIRGDGFLSALGSTPQSLVLILYCSAMGFAVGSLACYHTSLICQGITTYEKLRPDPSKVTGRSKSFWRNCHTEFCTPLPPSKLQLHKLVPGRGRQDLEEKMANAVHSMGSVHYDDDDDSSEESVLRSASSSPSMSSRMDGAVPFRDRMRPEIQV